MKITTDPKLSDEQKAFILAAASVGPVAIVEFRGQEPENVPYVDKETGRRRFIVKHNVALEFVGTGEQLPAEYFVPRSGEPVAKDKDQDEPALAEPLKIAKGEICLAEISGYIQSKGVTTARIGRLYPLSEIGRTLRSIDGDAPEYARTYILKSKKPIQ